jgi:hypothetical protein
MLYGLSAVLGLFTFVALLPVPGGVLLAPLPLLLFLFGLTGLMLGAEDRTVRQRGGVVRDPDKWRNGS